MVTSSTPSRHLLVPVSAHHGQDAYTHEMRPSDEEAYLVVTIDGQGADLLHALMERACAIADDLDAGLGTAGCRPRHPMVRWGALPDDFRLPGLYRGGEYGPGDATALEAARSRAGIEARAVFLPEAAVAELEDEGLLEEPASLTLQAQGEPGRPRAFFFGDRRDFNIAPLGWEQLVAAELFVREGEALRAAWRTIVATEAALALRALEAPGAETLRRTLTSADLRPLLTHAEGAVRQGAVMAARHLGIEDELPTSDPPETGGREAR